MTSAGNEGVVQSRLQVLHIHIFLAAPLDARHVAQPCADQHHQKYSIRQCRVHTIPRSKRCEHQHQVHQRYGQSQSYCNTNQQEQQVKHHGKTSSYHRRSSSNGLSDVNSPGCFLQVHFLKIKSGRSS